MENRVATNLFDLMVDPDSVTQDQEDLLRRAMKSLAHVCDGAISDDGTGFNASHTKLGHHLATMSYWDQECLQYAYSLAIFYQTQLRAMGYSINEIKNIPLQESDIVGASQAVKAKIDKEQQLAKQAIIMGKRTIKAANGGLVVSFEKEDHQFGLILELIRSSTAKRFDPNTKTWSLSLRKENLPVIEALKDQYCFHVLDQASEVIENLSNSDVKTFAGSIKPHSKGLQVAFDYDANKVSKIKSLSGSLGQAKFDPATKTWICPVAMLPALVATFPDFELNSSLSEQLKLSLVAKDIASEQQQLLEAKLSKLKASLLDEVLADGKQPRDYQVEGSIFLLKEKRAILAYDVGLGKTLTALLAARELGYPVVVICPASVRTNWGREASSIGMKVTTYSWAKFPEDKELPEKFTLIYDECFPYNTPIMTDRGLLPIGEIVENSLDVKVLSWSFSHCALEYKPVARYIKTTPKAALYKLSIGGKELVCTGNHKIYIEGKGYVQAKDINAGEIVRVLPTPNPIQKQGSIQNKPFLQSELFSQVASQTPSHYRTEQRNNQKSSCGYTGQACAVVVSTNESKEPYAQPRNTGQSIEETQGNWPQTKSTRRQWEAYAPSAIDPISSIKLAYRVCSQNNGYITFNAGLKPLLQDRHSKPRQENSNRGRRSIPSTTRTTSARPQERTGFELARVDSIEIYKQSDISGFEQSTTGNQHVYNLEVVDNHNYFANGVLVSNCHKIKNIKTLQAQNAIALALKAQAVYMLTGTPLPNGRPIETYNMLKIAGSIVTNNKSYYEKRYCDAKQTRFGWDNSGASNLDEWSRLTKDKILHKKKEDCLKSLPDLMRVLITVDGTDQQNKEYKQVISGLYSDYKLRVQQGTIGEADALVMMGILRRASSNIKVDAAVEKAQEILDSSSSDKVLIFTDFIESAEKIASLMKAELISGNVDSKKRQAMVDRFTDDPNRRVLVATIKAAGEGLNIQAANHIIMVDRTFVPKDYVQAEGRSHRSGQIRTVFSWWLQYNSSDQKVDALIMKKQERIELALEGERKTMRGVSSPGSLAMQALKDLFGGE